MSKRKIPLAEMIQALKEELEEAQKRGENSKLKLKVESVEIELSVAVSKTGSGEGSVKFWVIDLGAEYQEERSHIHKFTLTLKSGSTGDIEVSKTTNREVANK